MFVEIDEFPTEGLKEIKKIVDDELNKRDDAIFSALAENFWEAWKAIKEYDTYAYIGGYNNKKEIELSPLYISSKGRRNKIK